MNGPPGLGPLDQPGVRKHIEVLHDGGQRHCEGSCELADRQRRLLVEPGEQGAPRRVGNGREGAVEGRRRIVNHAVKYVPVGATCQPSARRSVAGWPPSRTAPVARRPMATDDGIGRAGFFDETGVPGNLCRSRAGRLLDDVQAPRGQRRRDRGGDVGHPQQRYAQAGRSQRGGGARAR